MLVDCSLNVLSYSTILPDEGESYIDEKNLEPSRLDLSRRERIIQSLIDINMEEHDSILRQLVGKVAIVYVSTVGNTKPSESIKGYINGLPNNNAYYAYNVLSNLDLDCTIDGLYTLYGSCAGSIQALELVSHLFSNSAYDYAIIIAVDTIDDDIYNLFKKMKVLTKKECKPFAKENTGFKLTESGTLIIVNRTQFSPSEPLEPGNLFRVEAISGVPFSDFTTPDIRALSRIVHSLYNLVTEPIIGILTHGTATSNCNAVEHEFLKDFYHDSTYVLENTKTYALKKYIGHTLSCSGLLELIDFHEAWMEDDPKSVAVYKKGDEDLYLDPEAIQLASDEDQFSEGEYIIKLAYGIGGLAYGMLVKFPKF